MKRRPIKNRASLTTTPLRRDALAVLDAGIRAIDTRQAVRTACSMKGSVLHVGRRRWDLDRFDHVYVIGIGKAAYDAAVALEGLLGDRITDGIVLDVRSGPLRRMKSVAGAHPLPTIRNMRATGEILALLKQVDSHDLIIVVVSGGGSALLCWPHQMKCGSLSVITKLLMDRGADIHDMNVVRKHLSEVQGGQLARLAYPASVVSLIFSDVPGDDLGTIASGPTVRDTSTVKDARRIMSRYGLTDACRPPACRLLETPKDPVYFRKVANMLIMRNRVALDAMRKEAKRRGYRVRILSDELRGDAMKVGHRLAALPRRGEMVLAGGETTVEVTSRHGKGGRNQELALAALKDVPDDGLVLSFASDGIDNTPAAGGIADAETRRAADRARLDPADSLARHDSFTFFKRTRQALLTGPTGANVSDLMLSVRSTAKKQRSRERR